MTVLSTLTLENEALRVRFSTAFGAKITSFYSKDMERELLFTPKEYRTPAFGDNFSNYDTSGIDECFPTIDPCVLEGESYPDHGSLWSIPWEVTGDKDGILAQVKDPVTGLLFSRRGTLEGSALLLHYVIKNEGPVPKDFLWAFHGLFAMERDMALLLPRGEVLQVDGPGILTIPRDAEAFPPKKAFKFYFSKISGPYGYLYKRHGRFLEFQTTPPLPYLGLWVTTGGFKGEVNWAFEPTTGFYDSLKRARESKTAITLGRGESYSFVLKLQLREVSYG